MSSLLMALNWRLCWCATHSITQSMQLVFKDGWYGHRGRMEGCSDWHRVCFN